MRVCLIGPVPPYRGGIAKYCYSLARELENRHELLLLSYRRQYPVLLYGRSSQTDPDLEPARIRREFRNLSYDVDSVNPVSWAETVEKIVAFKADSVILPWWVAYWAPMYLYLLHALKKRGIRVLLLCINVYGHEESPVRKFLTRLVLGRGDAMIVHSGQEREEILAFNPRATVREHFLPLFTYEAVRGTRHDGKLHLLFFGFVRPYKGLDILLQAVAILKDRDISLTVAGEFWHDTGEYLTLINELGIAGKVDVIDRYVSDEEMSGFFAWADLAVLPYRESRTSGIIATAYGFGKPVLVTDVGGFREVVSDGHTGKIVPAGDPQALARGIEWFLENRGVDFGRNIAGFTSRKMSWSSLVDALEELSCLNGHRTEDAPG